LEKRQNRPLSNLKYGACPARDAASKQNKLGYRSRKLVN